VCAVQLARFATTRQSFYAGLLTGFVCYAPQLVFFWRIFGPAAITLWTVLAFWLALFVALAHVALVRFGARRAVWLIPFLWTGLEYFHSELYYLKFAWLNVGFAWFGFGCGWLGVYGIGFCIVIYASFFLVKPAKQVVFGTLLISLCLVVLFFLFAPLLARSKYKLPRPNLRIAGVQLEFPNANQIRQALDKILVEHEKQLVEMQRQLNHGGITNWSSGDLYDHTNLDLIVLSEYTLDGEPPPALKDWCREHRKFLIVGGKYPAPGNNYYDTAFVISTNGEVVFKQAKCVPIQFFKDGLPAKEQTVWESPWGKIGVCICYDLSYARVTDELVRQGAQMLIVPTMDVVDWGKHEHELHARVAPIRAAEYGIPIFRAASSGISQGVDRLGNVRASASFPGDGEMIFFATRLGKPGSLPLDRWLAPFCVGVTGLFVAWLVVDTLRRRW
jgi:apolipoprotein N-acyltransferase